MKKAFQFRIYPNKNQEVKLNNTLSICRHLYNDTLAERKRQAELNKLRREFDVCPWGKPEWITCYEQQKNMAATKTSYQKEVFSQVLQNTYEKLILSKVGSIRIIQHREIEGKIKTCTVKKDIDQWYVTFSVEMDDPVPVEIKTKTGIDVGLLSLITMSNGDQIEPPEFLRAEKKLTREQIRLSRKKKRSNNRKKQGKIVGRTHRIIRNRRNDFAHKISRKLVDTYDHIAFENLQIRNMMQNPHLARSIADAGWGQLIQFTTYKAAYAGNVVELVNSGGTSQECICGYPVPKTLKMRIHKCPNCGLVAGRDHVSANVIEKRSSTVGTTGINACPSGLNRAMMKQDAQAL